MNSRAKNQNFEAPEQSRPGGEDVYRHGPAYRALAYAVGGAVALSFGVIGWVLVTTGGADVNWGAYTGMGVGLAGAATSVPVLLSELHLTEAGLRRSGPLQAEVTVSFEEVRRVFIGGVSVEIYVDADHEPALTFHRRVQDSDDLIEKLVAHLPASAEIDHPSGELDGRFEIA